MKIQGTADDFHVLEQTPHSLFWNFDALEYIFMGLATFVAIPVFDENGFQKCVRIAFLANAAVTPLIAFVYFYPGFFKQITFSRISVSRYGTFVYATACNNV
ncbi:MAG: hypothetical protein ABI325_04130 [Ginsengibacter sp.]